MQRASGCPDKPATGRPGGLSRGLRVPCAARAAPPTRQVFALSSCVGRCWPHRAGGRGGSQGGNMHYKASAAKHAEQSLVLNPLSVRVRRLLLLSRSLHSFLIGSHALRRHLWLRRPAGPSSGYNLFSSFICLFRVSFWKCQRDRCGSVCSDPPPFPMPRWVGSSLRAASSCSAVLLFQSRWTQMWVN